MAESRHDNEEMFSKLNFLPPPSGAIPDDDEQNFYNRDTPELVRLHSFGGRKPYSKYRT